MTRTLPPLNALRAFEAAGRLGSFTRAAAELNVSHSAISRHVRGLEERLNVHLFRKVAQGVELTAPGRSYLERLTPLFDALSDATEELTGTPSGRVTLTTETSLAQKWLIPRLPQFEADHPDVDLEFSVTTNLLDIEAHDMDMALRYLSPGKATDGLEPVFTAPVQAYCAPHFAGGKAAELTPQELAKCRLIEEATFRVWPTWFAAAGVDPLPPLNLTHPMNAVLAIEAAVAGHGALLTSPELAEPDVAAGKLVQISDVGVPFGGYYLVTNSRAGRRKAVRTVRNWLLEQTVAYRP